MDRLNDFFKAIRTDPRIGKSHISIYCALLNMPAESTGVIRFYRSEVMNTARVTGIGTFHRVINDLNEFGYIDYRPCFNHRYKSSVYIKDL